MIMVTDGNLILSEGENSADAMAALIRFAPIRVEISTDQNGSKHVYLSNRRWKVKRHLIGSYTDEFSEREIYSDILGRVARMCGYRVRVF